VSTAPLSVAAARALLLAEAVVTESEPVPLAECLGRVSAEPVRAGAPLPGFDNSAMDGYAVRSADLAAGAVPLRIVGESRAGEPAAVALAAGEAARISTGAAIPAGADAVVPLEQAREQDGAVLLVEQAREQDGAVVPTAAPVSPGAFVRRAGEDLEAGAVALAAGARIGPAELGVLAGVGVPTLVCARRPRLTVLTGGDELLAPGEQAGPGQIFDSNRFSLVAMGREAGAEARYGGGMPDTLKQTRAAIAAGLERADLLVLCGGVSVGRHDHVKEALAELGVEQLFWRVALRPGAPTWGGVLRRPGGRPTLVFGLPGNPVSAQVTFRLFVVPALLASSGRDPEAGRASAVLGEQARGLPNRDVYLRCRLEPGAEGWRAFATGERQGSHILTSMLGADCLAVIPAGRERLAAGERVEVLLL
jgi:molybdopterin molybdotransferase